MTTVSDPMGDSLSDYVEYTSELFLQEARTMKYVATNSHLSFLENYSWKH